MSNANAWVVKLEDGSANSAATQGAALDLVSLVLGTGNPCTLWHLQGAWTCVAVYTIGSVAFRCPCCGDGVMGRRPVCDDCAAEGCELTVDASGEAGWWNCLVAEQRDEDGEPS